MGHRPHPLCEKKNDKMRSLKIAAVAIFLFVAFSRPARATDTLDCNFKDSLLRLNVNSEGAVADAILYRGETEYKILTLQAVKLKWARGLPPYDANFLKIESKKTDKLPAFTVDVEGTNGAITLEGETSQMICDWVR